MPGSSFLLPGFFNFFCLYLPLMKLFFGLMAILLLSLSFFPCGDNQECVKDAATANVENNNHTNHNHSSESCTLFCSCSCCAASAFYSAIPQTEPSKAVFFSEKYPLYNIGFNTEAHESIFQPPKLS